MAVTKIWVVKNNLRQLLSYVCNPEKVTEKASEETLKVLVEYGADPSKTEQSLYVSGVECTQENAVRVMSNLLKRNKKDSDRVAYHAYQSFAKGEVSARTAHEIGVKFAEEMWGDNFPVLVTTHLDRGHIHNHYAICGVGFDGKRFRADTKNYQRMREVSDRLCMEHGLSVIKNPQRGRTRHIGEIKAEEEGRMTVRGVIRRDMDIVINHCFNLKQFMTEFQALGYTIEPRGKYMRIRPDQSTKWFRMDKLGENYTFERVKERLRENDRTGYFVQYERFPKREKPKGLYALYLHYCYLLGALPKVRPNNKEAYAVIREDVRRARMYNEEAKLLGKYNINTAEELSLFTKNLSGKFTALAKERAGLRNRLRRMHDTEEMQPIKDKISELSSQMAQIRREMKLCEDIALRSGVVDMVVNTIEIPDKEIQQQRNRNKEERKV